MLHTPTPRPSFVGDTVLLELADAEAATFGYVRTDDLDAIHHHANVLFTVYMQRFVPSIRSRVEANEDVHVEIGERLRHYVPATRTQQPRAVAPYYILEYNEQQWWEKTMRHSTRPRHGTIMCANLLTGLAAYGGRWVDVAEDVWRLPSMDDLPFEGHMHFIQLHIDDDPTAATSVHTYTIFYLLRIRETTTIVPLSFYAIGMVARTVPTPDKAEKKQYPLTFLVNTAPETSDECTRPHIEDTLYVVRRVHERSDTSSSVTYGQTILADLFPPKTV